MLLLRLGFLLDFKARIFQTSVDVFVFGLPFQNVLEVFDRLFILAAREVGLSPSVVGFQVSGVKFEAFVGVLNAGAIAFNFEVGEGTV